MTTKFLVKTSCASMPSNCRGRYRHIAILEVESDIEEVSMISERARGVIRIVHFWGPLHAGSESPRTQYGRTLAQAHAECERLNAERTLKSE